MPSRWYDGREILELLSSPTDLLDTLSFVAAVEDGATAGREAETIARGVERHVCEHGDEPITDVFAELDLLHLLRRPRHGARPEDAR